MVYFSENFEYYQRWNYINASEITLSVALLKIVTKKIVLPINTLPQDMTADGSLAELPKNRIFFLRKMGLCDLLCYCAYLGW